MLNLMEVAAGQLIRLNNGAICEVVENMDDGIWVQARVVKNEADPGAVGAEELVHCEEVAGRAEAGDVAGP